ncbi:putative coiled-coil domain-containing protein 195 [Hemicordylus capensis]|uniref:putative coiled-coil domain-containing protein 195 n=1 Tax=Hemicordylus capensis TaxID=884348 RepID=UPI002304A6FC|nr:putative coiled-coil domain-containing protein 195 [Hemicordylus capensis]
MEGNQQLLQVIHDMRSEIIKLERENRALRGELKFSGQKGAKREEATGEDPRRDETRSLSDSGEEAAGNPVALRRNVSAGSTLMLQEQKGNIMTVRRYSISSSVPSLSGNKHHKTDKRNPFKGALEVKGIMKQPAFPTDMQLSNKEEKGFTKMPGDCLSNNTSNKRRSFQDHVYKCRGKVKAVSFLLPVDISPYSENQGSFTCPQNQNTKQLSTIIEKDM